MGIEPWDASCCGTSPAKNYSNERAECRCFPSKMSHLGLLHAQRLEALGEPGIDGFTCQDARGLEEVGAGLIGHPRVAADRRHRRAVLGVDRQAPADQVACRRGEERVAREDKVALRDGLGQRHVGAF